MSDKEDHEKLVSALQKDIALQVYDTGIYQNPTSDKEPQGAIDSYVIAATGRAVMNIRNRETGEQTSPAIIEEGKGINIKNAQDGYIEALALANQYFNKNGDDVIEAKEVESRQFNPKHKAMDQTLSGIVMRASEGYHSFPLADKDQNGYLDSSELKFPYTNPEFSKYDLDKDSQLSIEELRKSDNEAFKVLTNSFKDVPDPVGTKIDPVKGQSAPVNEESKER